MAALTFDALLKGLKPTGGAAPNPVYYLHGEEDVLKEEAVRALLERAVDPAARDFNLDTRAAADLDPEALRALVDTPPLLAERRAVVLRGIEQLNKKLGTEILISDIVFRSAGDLQGCAGAALSEQVKGIADAVTVYPIAGIVSTVAR